MLNMHGQTPLNSTDCAGNLRTSTLLRVSVLIGLIPQAFIGPPIADYVLHL